MINSKNTALERLEEYVQKKPDSAAVIFHPEERMTFGELWELSGKIYAWLKSKGIGKEDVVMYCLPRGLMLYACMTGTMRAGAAFVLSETQNAPERTEFIRQDSKCRLFVDESCLEEILACTPLDGYEPIDLHALCYIAYTSGTTGNPKGVMHEYGSLDNAWKAVIVDGKPIMDEDDIFLTMSPMNFVAVPIIFSYSCAHGCAVALMPYEYSTSKDSFLRYLDRAGVTCGYLTPSFIRKSSPLPLPWHMCIISSEPADGLFLPGVDCYNAYASTEGGCLLSVYKLPEPMYPAPVGRSYSDVKLVILDDDGKEVPCGHIGEVCFKTPYVRGYLHQVRDHAGHDSDIKTGLRDDGFFHTGDAGKIQSDGNMLTLGRIDEMFKIRGCRIEPDEVADAVTKASGISQVIVKGYVFRDISSIDVFYAGDTEADPVSLYEALTGEMPEYMIPTNYIRLKEFPLLPSRKIDKLKLLPPEGDWEGFRKDAPYPLSLIDKGRSASIYDMGEGMVLKQYIPTVPYKAAYTELINTRIARSIGLPVPRVCSITRSESGYGILMEKLNGTNLERMIRERPEERLSLIDKFADSVRALHKVKAEGTGLADAVDESLALCSRLEGSIFSDRERELIRRIFECIPRTDTFTHGDCHPGNAMWDEGQIHFFDLTVAQKGHPVFDLLGMYSHYVFLPSFVSDEKFEETNRMTKSEAETLYCRFLETYYPEKSETDLSLVNEWIRGVHAARLCTVSVALPGLFTKEMLDEVRQRAVNFSLRYCADGSVCPFSV